MSQTLLTFQLPVIGPDGTEYEARACGRESTGGTWEGCIEFLPLDGGKPVRSSRETTQPNRVDTEYWATGLRPVYLEGALRRALAGPPRAARVAGTAPSIFSEPAPNLRRETLQDRSQPDECSDRPESPFTITGIRVHHGRNRCSASAERAFTLKRNECSRWTGIRKISTYRARVLEKLGVKNSAGIVHYAIRNGLVM